MWEKAKKYFGYDIGYSKTERQVELDIAKGLSILFMVWIHVFEELSPSSDDLLVMLAKVMGGPFAAPIFMICMGIGIVYSKHSTPKQMMHRGLSLLEIGLLLNVFRFVIPDILLYCITKDTAYLAATFEIFSVDILQFAGLAFLFFALMKKLKTKKVILLLIGALTSVAGTLLSGLSTNSYSINQALGFLWGTNTASYFPFLNWIIYPIVGVVFGDFLKHCKNKDKFYLWTTPIAAVIMLGYLYFTIEYGLMFMSDGSYYHHGTWDAIFFTILTFFVFGVCYALTRIFKKCSFSVLTRWSRHINSIYFTHWVLIGIALIVEKGIYNITVLPVWFATMLAVIMMVLSDGTATLYSDKIKLLMNGKKIKTKRIIQISFIALVCVSIVCASFFHWAFYDSRNYFKNSQYVEMTDGTKLAVDIYLPKGSERKSLPVIFQYTPYGRAFVVGKELNLFDKIGYKFATGTAGPVLDRVNSSNTVYGSTAEMVNMFLESGYVYVCADMRGTGASFGTKVDFHPIFAKDGKELIDWMAKQEWCDGNVGMFGGSYLGYSQLITAGQKPEALKCIIPEVTPLDGYTGEIRPGGVFLWSYSQQDMQIYLEHNYYMPDEWIYPSSPVVDEDEDGDLLDEIPLDLNGNGSFLDDYNYPANRNDEPKYCDGNKREHIYYLASREHLDNIPYSNLGPVMDYINTEFTYGNDVCTSYEVSPSAAIKSIMESGIAIYNHGGWNDPFVRGTVELYNTLKETNPCKMIIGPDYHMGTSPFWKYCGDDEDEMLTAYGEIWLRFYDYYLKGIENGIDNENPISIYVMKGGGWRSEAEWPLARQKDKTFYLSENGKLSISLDTAGTDTYKVDFTHSSQWDNEGWPANRWRMETPGGLPIRTEMDKKCLIYTSDPLKEDTEVTGHPFIDLWVSSTASTGDFYVYLEDVDENGKAVLVTEGLLNAQFHKLYDNDEMILGGDSDINVKPELPWHGYEKGQADLDVFANGEIVKLTIDLLPTSWVFKAGNSIRISIACADAPTFELTPELCPDNNPTNPNNIIPEITVHRTELYRSGIILPIIPKN